VARPRALVTGAAGFVGGHLIAHLAARGVEAAASRVRLPDRAGFARLLAETRPHAVIHLAAVSFLPAAERDPRAALATNVDGVRSVLEALGEADPGGSTRFILISSGHVYRPQNGQVLDEDSPVDPPTTYGRTKLAAEILSRIWCEAEPRRPLWVFRPFNHTGPRQPPIYAASSFARQAALIEAGRMAPVLETGDLEVRRDFSDVRDIVRAYAGAAVGEVPPGTYNLASGRSLSLGEVVERYRKLAKVAFEVRPRMEPDRAGEARDIRACAERIAGASGWRAEIPIETTLGDLLADWRERTAAGEAGP